MKNNSQSNGLTLSQTIDKWKVNKGLLASLMPMPQGTFNNKLNESQTAYRFTDEEEEKLKEILRDMIGDLEIVAGITFNKALSTIVNPK